MVADELPVISLIGRALTMVITGLNKSKKKSKLLLHKITISDKISD